MTTEFIQIKCDHATIRPANLHCFEINGQGGIRAAIRIIHQLFKIFSTYLDWQNAVLEAVVIEDVGKRC